MACGRTENKTAAPATASTTPAPAPWAITVQPLQVPAPAGSGEPQLTPSRNGVVLSWLEQTGPKATLRFAERASGTWSDARTVASGSDWFVSAADVPSVMRMSDGTLVANWYQTTQIELEAYNLWLSYSRDEGKTWARPFMPHHDKTKTQHGFASLFELPEKGLGLVWLDAREWELAKDDPLGGAVMMRFASFDPQWKQTADETVNLKVCDCCQTSVAVTADGVIIAFRDRSDGEVRDIHVSRREGGKWTDAVPVHQDNWEIDSCPVNGPAVSARGRDVATAWFSAPKNEGHAYVAFSRDSGRTWEAPIRLDDAKSIGHVDVELLDDGSAVATWVEFADGRGRFKTRRVERSGAKSTAIDISGSGPGRVSGYPRLARSGDELLFAWDESTNAEGSADVGQQVKAAVAKLPAR